MRRFGLIAISLAAALAGCGSSAAQNNQAALQPPADDAVDAQPVRPEHRTSTLTAAWLAGSWQTGEGSCGAGDTFFTLAPDGGYTFIAESGRWRLEGSNLTIEVAEGGEDGGSRAGDRHTTRVTIIGPNEAEFRAGAAPPTRVYRCHTSPT